MNRARALVLRGLFCSLVLMVQTSSAQNNPEKLPPFPPLQQSQFPQLPPLEQPIVRVYHGGFLFLFSEPNCGPIGVRARTVGQLDSLPSTIVQLTLKNTNSVAMISERFTFHGVATRDEYWPVPQQAHAKTVENVRSVMVDAGQQVTVDALVTGFSDIKHIELNSVTYADGTSWQPIDGNTCIVTPGSL